MLSRSELNISIEGGTDVIGRTEIGFNNGATLNDMSPTFDPDTSTVTVTVTKLNR